MGTQGAFDAAYAGRRVLVTGDTGFKGTWLWQWLEALGAEVHGLALPPPTQPSLWEQASLDGAGRHRECDVRDPDAVAARIDAVQPEAIFHLAAQSIVRESYEAPLPTFATNVMGVAHVVDALRTNPRPCALVIVTSDKCYAGDPGTLGHAEGDALGGRDPYSASKGAAEIVTAAYRESFFPADEHDRHGVGIASVRSGNVIGPGDWARDRIVPDAIRALSAGEAVPVRNPGATRPWQHVLEPLAGYLWVGARLLGGRPAEACQAWNFGPALEACRPVREIVDAILKAWGDGRWETAAPGGPPESPTLALAIDKAAAELDWQPVWELGEAIERTVHGYRALLDAPNPDAVRALMTREIEAYTARAADAGRSWAAGAA
ncbi:MAG: CDP-glucose 4,6-dehydratase [Myxococcota bacterium]